jgi:hypothetical protein
MADVAPGCDTRSNTLPRRPKRLGKLIPQSFHLPFPLISRSRISHFVLSYTNLTNTISITITSFSRINSVAIGLRCKDGVVLAVEKVQTSKLLVKGANKRIVSVDNHVGLVSVDANNMSRRHLFARKMSERSEIWEIRRLIKLSSPFLLRFYCEHDRPIPLSPELL